MTKAKKKFVTNRRKKEYFRAKMVKERAEKLQEKMMDHMRSSDYVEHVSEPPCCGHESD